MNSCFFIGHHDAPESIYPALLTQVERHITEYAVTEFFVGRYGAFDRMAARAVRTVKACHPGATLTLLLPYHPSTYKPAQAADFANFDGTYYPAGLESVPRRYAIVRANRAMAEQCTHLIAYLHYSSGNTSAIVNYARRQGAHITAL